MGGGGRKDRGEGLGRALVRQRNKAAAAAKERGQALILSRRAQQPPPLESVIDVSDIDAVLQRAAEDDLLLGDDAHDASLSAASGSGLIDLDGTGETEEERRRLRQEQEALHADNLRVPRRPPWTAQMTVEELDANERRAFLESGANPPVRLRKAEASPPPAGRTPPPPPPPAVLYPSSTSVLRQRLRQEEERKQAVKQSWDEPLAHRGPRLRASPPRRGRGPAVEGEADLGGWAERGSREPEAEAGLGAGGRGAGPRQGGSRRPEGRGGGAPGGRRRFGEEVGGGDLGRRRAAGGVGDFAPGGAGGADLEAGRAARSSSGWRIEDKKSSD